MIDLDRSVGTALRKDWEVIRMRSSKTYRQRRDQHLTIDQDVIMLVDFGESGTVHGVHPALVMSRCENRKANGRVLVIPLYRSASYGMKVPSVKIRQIDCVQLRHDMYAQPMLLQSVLVGQIIRRVGIVQSDAVHKELEILLWEEVSA